MAESRWRHPVHELASIRSELDRRLQHLRERRGSEAPPVAAPVTAGAWCPALDVEETPDAFVFHAELPGIAADELDVSLEGHTLMIRGERTFYADKEAGDFRRIERSFGRFDRRVRLPDDADIDRIDASFGDGVLTVSVPKASSTARTRVTIATATDEPAGTADV